MSAPRRRRCAPFGGGGPTAGRSWWRSTSFQLTDAQAATITVAELDRAIGLFEMVRHLTGDDVEWELTWPSAAAASASIGRLLQLPARAPLLTLDLVGVCHSGRRAYRAIRISRAGGRARRVRAVGPRLTARAAHRQV